MLNRTLFQTDPTSFNIPNDGVTTVTQPATPQQWAVLEYELRTFVCEGQYHTGLERILSTYLSHLSQSKQPAVWVSGFYGSGKSHLVRVLEHYWHNRTLPDGSSARGLSDLPDDITDLLTELTTAGEQRGGIWAAAGRLNPGSLPIRLDMLRVVLESAGLPTEYAPARFALWLKRQGIYDRVVAAIEADGLSFAEELRDMYVSDLLADSLLQAKPDLAANAREARGLLKAQFPNKTDITNHELLDTVRTVLELQSTTPGRLPVTLLAFDEVQQAIGEDNARALEVQAIVEDLCSQFGGNLLVIATGQSAIQATPQLQKLQGRFTVRVELTDQDVERVIRQVVLRKDETQVPALKSVLDDCSGEIDRHLAGTKIAPTATDKAILVADYPLLPTRRRFWERVLPAIDISGSTAQLRTQLHTVHEAARAVADRAVGTVVGGDFIYFQQKDVMLASGVLLRDLSATIEKLDDGTPDGRLRARLCATIFLINQLPTTGQMATGLRADATTLADLLVEDLPGGSGELRRRVPLLLTKLVEDGTLMLDGGAYALQTQESMEWQQEFTRRQGSIRADAVRIAGDRSAALHLAVTQALKGVTLTQGVNKTPRKIDLHFGQEAPSTTTVNVPVWVRDEWSGSVTEKSVREEAQAAGTNSPLVLVLLPRVQSDELSSALAAAAAAGAILDARPSKQTTAEGLAARRAMETRRDMAAAKVDDIIATVLRGAKVYQAGGNEVVDETPAAAIRQAAENALVRLFPEFEVTNVPGWNTVVNRAGQGNANALEAVGYDGAVADYPAARQVLAEISASGTKGSDIRAHFTGPGFGWPQDAVDGLLLTLLNADLVSARDKSGQAVNAKKIPQSQIGVTTFRGEEYVLTATQKMHLRGLAQALGIPHVAGGDEASGIQRGLQRLLDVAAAASGAAPLPPKPDTAAIEALQALSGNEQLLRAYEQREGLKDQYKAWSTLAEAKTARLDRWRLLEQLMAHAGALPEAEAIRPQMDAIRQQRSLLADPDPVKPLLDTLTAALRAAAQAARHEVDETRQRELAAIADTAEWDQRQLSDADWKAIFAAHRLGPIDPLDVSTDDKLLAALNAKSLDAWRMELEAIPTRIQQAREEAARRVAPQAVTVRPKSITLKSAEEVEAYLADLRAEILAHIEDGHSVII